MKLIQQFSRIETAEMADHLQEGLWRKISVPQLRVFYKPLIPARVERAIDF